MLLVATTSARGQVLSNRQLLVMVHVVIILRGDRDPAVNSQGHFSSVHPLTTTGFTAIGTPPWMRPDPGPASRHLAP